MKKKAIVLTFKKSTKGTHVYENSDYNISFYLPRPLLDEPGNPPQSIKMTLEG